MDWIPIIFVTFKVLVLCIGMFFAVRWHYYRGKNENEKRALLRGSAKAAAVFVLSLFVLGLITFGLARQLGLDLSFP
jgi:uncharacterized BrkB/YihY/UPF0761 family membrane protein